MLRFINSFDTFGSSIRPHGATIFERELPLLTPIMSLLLNYSINESMQYGGR